MDKWIDGLTEVQRIKSDEEDESGQDSSDADVKFRLNVVVVTVGDFSAEASVTGDAETVGEDAGDGQWLSGEQGQD